MTKKTKIIIFSSLALVGILYVATKGKGNSNSGGQGGGGNGNGGSGGLDVNLLANDLFTAMEGCGTAWDNGDSGGVTGIMKSLKSDSDFDALSMAFGQRTIHACKIAFWSDDFTGNMVECLKDELDDSETAEINDILASNGITRKI